MDAPYYNGSDNRDELTQEDPMCESCGVSPSEPCEPDCECEYCLRSAERRYAERESYCEELNREVMAEIQRTLK